MTAEFRANLRITLIIIAVNLAINIIALVGFNQMRSTAMRQASRERQQLSVKMDRAWEQRIKLTAHLEQTCRK